MKSKSKLLLQLALLLWATLSISVRNRRIVDEEGRQIRFHGTNVVVKVPPYIPVIDKYDPQWSFSKEDMENCKKLGFNGIRLGMMWAGVEPSSNGYNETYLDEMERLINMAGSYGIYSLIDFHQDLIAQKFCGDGVPTWLMNELHLYKTFPFPVSKPIKLNSSGLPSWTDCNTNGWGLYYFSYDVGEAFKELYKSGSKLNTKFEQFWVKIATRFKGNKYVIGYELINEPFVGNAIRDLPLVIPSIAERLRFQHFYDRLAFKIRQVDPDTLIFFEPITFDNAVPVGFTHPPGGRKYANKSVLSYHYYNPPALGFNTIDARVADGVRLGVPSFLSEYGSTEVQVMERAMKYQQSWLYWIYKSYGKNWGSTSTIMNNSEVQPSRIMTYLQRIAGELKTQFFNSTTKHYTASYLATAEGKSILYFSQQLHYKNGYSLSLFPRQQMSYAINGNFIEIIYHGESAREVMIDLIPI